MKSPSPTTFSFENPKETKFSVASELLRELGERLVGAPHIALAELIKNGYDADAHKLTIKFAADHIEIVDDGHGMTLDSFNKFWMRVGTTHKQDERVSPELKRPMTGSKGVGRLAAQFLAKRVEMRTVSKDKLTSELRAYVDWEKSVDAGELTEAEAQYEVVKSPQSLFIDKPYGTRIVLSELKQSWTEEEFRKLGSAIWWLQPPFRSNPNLENDLQRDFEVILDANNPKITEEFEDRLRAPMNNWHARISGTIVPLTGKKKSRERLVDLKVEFRGFEEPIKHKYTIPFPASYDVPYCRVDVVEFEIRVYYLAGKQKYSVSVEDAREYFKKFGGIHVYDAGFHLPYYGSESDWLDLEKEHARRIHRSELLPETLQEQRGLNFLPSQDRIFGVVNVDTSTERNFAQDTDRLFDDFAPEDYLKISVTRDRLIENGAFADLKYIVRYAMHFYAMQEAKRQYKLNAERNPVEAPIKTIAALAEVVGDLTDAGSIEPATASILKKQITLVKRDSDERESVLKNQSGLLGALATAGISTIAYEHELGKQFQLIEEIIVDLQKLKLKESTSQQVLDQVIEKLRSWLNKAQATRAIFSPLMNEDDRKAEGRFKAKLLIEQVTEQIAVLMRGIKIDSSGFDPELRLPDGKFIEWSTIFQNVLVNAVNAMLDSNKRQIFVSSRERGRFHEILIQDTGAGIDIGASEKLFEPFERQSKISRERQQLGLGGTGIGLTIVRMIAENRNCKVSFVEPDKGFKTAFSLSWSETK